MEINKLKIQMRHQRICMKTLLTGLFTEDKESDRDSFDKFWTLLALEGTFSKYTFSARTLGLLRRLSTNDALLFARGLGRGEWFTRLLSVTLVRVLADESFMEDPRNDDLIKIGGKGGGGGMFILEEISNSARWPCVTSVSLENFPFSFSGFEFLSWKFSVEVGLFFIILFFTTFSTGTVPTVKAEEVSLDESPDKSVESFGFDLGLASLGLSEDVDLLWMSGFLLLVLRCAFPSPESLAWLSSVSLSCSCACLLAANLADCLVTFPFSSESRKKKKKHTLQL